jgi:hypothetical protein
LWEVREGKIEIEAKRGQNVPGDSGSGNPVSLFLILLFESLLEWLLCADDAIVFTVDVGESGFIFCLVAGGRFCVWIAIIGRSFAELFSGNSSVES